MNDHLKVPLLIITYFVKFKVYFTTNGESGLFGGMNRVWSPSGKKSALNRWISERTFSPIVLNAIFHNTKLNKKPKNIFNF